MPAPTIVFDLDGTLIDTAPDLVDTLNLVLQRERVPALPYDKARAMIGGGARLMIERALKDQGRNFAPDAVDQLFETFIAHYSAHIADRSRPFPGLEGALDRLARDGCLLAICTNKLEWLSTRLLDALSLSDRFAAICGQDTFGVKKPDPDALLKTIARAGGDAAHAIMVGDSAIDVTVARAAGIPVVAVDFGYTDVPVAALAADRVIDHFDRLPDAVFELLPQLAKPARLSQDPVNTALTINKADG